MEHRYVCVMPFRRLKGEQPGILKDLNLVKADNCSHVQIRSRLWLFSVLSAVLCDEIRPDGFLLCFYAKEMSWVSRCLWHLSSYAIINFPSFKSFLLCNPSVVWQRRSNEPFRYLLLQLFFLDDNPWMAMTPTSRSANVLENRFSSRLTRRVGLAFSKTARSRMSK